MNINKNANNSFKRKINYDRYGGKRDRQNKFLQATATTAIGTLLS
jgi:hypothetical protein